MGQTQTSLAAFFDFFDFFALAAGVETAVGWATAVEGVASSAQVEIPVSIRTAAKTPIPNNFLILRSFLNLNSYPWPEAGSAITYPIWATHFQRPWGSRG